MNGSIEQQKHAKKTDYLYSQVHVMGAGHILAACVLVTIYWSQINSDVLVGWLLAMFAATAHRFYIAHAFQRRDRYASNELWYTIYARGVVINGCLWGAMAIFIAHQLGVAQMTYMLMVVGALVAGTSIGNGALFSIYTRFATPALVPLAIYLLTQISSDKFMVGILVLCWFAFMYSIAWRFNKFVSTSLGYEFENIALLRQLEADKAQIRKLKENNILQEKAINNLQNASVKKATRYVPGSRLATAQEKSALRFAHK